MAAGWEYQIVEEANPASLQERLTTLSQTGWEPVSLGYAGDTRLLALVKRAASPDGSPPDNTRVPAGTVNR